MTYNVIYIYILYLSLYHKPYLAYVFVSTLLSLNLGGPTNRTAGHIRYLNGPNNHSNVDLNQTCDNRSLTGRHHVVTIHLISKGESSTLYW